MILIIGHGELFQKAGILHRDISIYNLLIINICHGLLIDLDYALDTKMAPEDIKGPRGVRTVSKTISHYSVKCSPLVGHTSIYGGRITMGL